MRRSSQKRARSFRSSLAAKSCFYGAISLFVIFAINSGHSTDSVTTSQRKPVASTLEPTTSSIVPDKPSFDQVVATDLAANLASTVELPIANNVTNQAISLSAKSEFSQTSDDVISKPSSLSTSGATHIDITSYTAKTGDTVTGVAAQYGLQPNSIKWSNNLQSDALEPGRQLVIPPVDGVVVTAQNGDTYATLAQKYNANPERVALFNDETGSGGVVAGQQIVIPGGTVAAPTAPATSRSSAPSTVRTSADFAMVIGGGNRYDYGYCTWYAYNRRAALGKPIGGMWGNASSWASLARSSGFSVNNTPSVGAVMQTASGAGGYGHVAVVESVGVDGSITVSEMNYAGWNRISSRTLSASEAASYNYIQ